MAFKFTGYTLEKPRVSSANKITTLPPDVYVPTAKLNDYESVWDPNDENPGNRAEYLVQSNKNAKLPLASFRWTKNEPNRARFGWNGSVSRWDPLPGLPPTVLTSNAAITVGDSDHLDIQIKPSPNYNLAEETPASIRLTINDVAVTINIVDDLSTSVVEIPVSGTVSLFKQDNVIRINSVDCEPHPVMWFGNVFASFKDSTGVIGKVGEILYLQPVPISGEKSIIRIGNYPPLHLGDNTPVSGEFYVSNTGEVTISDADITEYGGRYVYYLGVNNGLNSQAQPVTSPSTDYSDPDAFENVRSIGTINNPELATLYGSPVTEGGEIFVYAKSGDNTYVFSKPQWVDYDPSPGDLKRGSIAIRRTTGQITTSTSDRSSKGDWDLYWVTGDVHIEDGIHCRFFRNIAYPTTWNEPDVYATGSYTSDEPFDVKIGGSSTIPLFVTPIHNNNLRFDVVALSGAFPAGQLAEDGITPSGKDGAYVISESGTELVLHRRVNNLEVSLPEDTYAVNLPHSVLLGREYSFEYKYRDGKPWASLDSDRYILSSSAGSVTLKSIVTEETLADNVLSPCTLNLPLLSVHRFYKAESTVGSAPQIRTSYSRVRIDLESDLLEVSPILGYTGETVLGQPSWFQDTESELPIHTLVEVGSRILVHGVTTSTHTVTGVSAPVGDTPSRVIVTPNIAYSDSDLRYSIHLKPQSMDDLEYSVDPWSGHIIFSQNILDNFPEEDVWVGYQYPLNEVNFSPDGSISLNQGLLSEDKVLAEYYQPIDLDEPGVLVEEFLEIERTSTAVVHNSLSYATFNPEGHEVVDGSARVYIKGRPIKSPDQYTIDDSKIMFTNAKVGISDNVIIKFKTKTALGGEKAFSTSFTPRDTRLSLVSNTNEFSVVGDRSSLAGVIVLFDGDAYTINTAVFNPGLNTTVITLADDEYLRRQYTAPIVLVSSKILESSDYTLVGTCDFAVGSVTFTSKNDLVQNWQPGHIVRVTSTKSFTAMVSGAKQSGDDVVVSFVGPSPCTTVSGNVYRSDLPVVPTGEVNFKLSKEMIPTESISVWVCPVNEDPSDEYTSTSYKIEGSRVLVLKTPIQEGQKVVSSYTARDYLPAGSSFRASYTRMVDTTADGFKSQSLSGVFDYFAPDSTYFRIEHISTTLGEVSADLKSDTSSQVPSRGVSSTPSTPENWDYGSVGFIAKRGKLVSSDYVAKRFLSYVNDVCISFEEILSNVDGRVVGDADGTFTPEADIDALVCMRLRPKEIVSSGTIGEPTPDNQDAIKSYTNFPFGYRIDWLGTWAYAWERHKYSRFFPTWSVKEGITDPSLEYADDDDVFDLETEHPSRVRGWKKPGVCIVTSGVNDGAVIIPVNNPINDYANGVRQIIAGDVISIVRLDGTVAAPGSKVTDSTTTSITLQNGGAPTEEEIVLLAKLRLPIDAWGTVEHIVYAGDTVYTLDPKWKEGPNFDVTEDGVVTHDPGDSAYYPEPNQLVKFKFKTVWTDPNPRKIPALNSVGTDDRECLSIPRIQPKLPVSSTTPVTSLNTEPYLLSLVLEYLQSMLTDTQESLTGLAGVVSGDGMTLTQAGGFSTTIVGDLVVIPEASNSGSGGMQMCLSSDADSVYVGMKIDGVGIDYEIDYEEGTGVVSDPTILLLDAPSGISALTGDEYLVITSAVNGGMYKIASMTNVPSPRFVIDAGVPFSNIAGANHTYRLVIRRSGAVSTSTILTHDLGADNFLSIPVGSKLTVDEGVPGVGVCNGVWEVLSSNGTTITVKGCFPSGNDKQWFVDRGCMDVDEFVMVDITSLSRITCRSIDLTETFTPGTQILILYGPNIGRYLVESSNLSTGDTLVVVTGLVYPGYDAAHPFRWYDSASNDEDTKAYIRRPRRDSNLIRNYAEAMGSLSGIFKTNQRNRVYGECQVADTVLTDFVSNLTGVSEGDLVFIPDKSPNRLIRKVSSVVNNDITLSIGTELETKRVRYRIDNNTPTNQIDNWDNLREQVLSSLIVSGSGAVQNNKLDIITAVDLTGLTSGVVYVSSDTNPMLSIGVIDPDNSKITVSQEFVSAGNIDFEVWGTVPFIGTEVVEVVCEGWTNLRQYIAWDDINIPIITYDPPRNPPNPTYGDATDGVLTDRLSAVQGRIDYLNGVLNESEGLIDKIESILNSGPNLNGARYTWINSRINLKSGFLQRILRMDLEKEQQEKELLESILKTLILESM